MRKGALIGLGALLAVTATVNGQSVRATGISTLQYVRIRPLVDDSVTIGQTAGDGLLRRTLNGQLVSCTDGERWCRYLRSSTEVTIVPVVQDISLSAWGLGQGVRAFARLRVRGMFGGNEDLWPRGDDVFDALIAYVEVERGRLRFRGGRQWLASGLGYHNYDGVSARFRPFPEVSIEAFLGSSLARGLNEPRTSESLSAIEPFAPDNRGILMGGRASWRPSPRLALSALYQRDIRSDLYGIYSEQVAADGTFRSGNLSLAGSLEADLPGRTINDGRVRVDYQIQPGLGAGLRARKYQPYYEMWTIWGAFSPVGFREAGGSAWWRPPGRPWEITIDAARRGYGDTYASPVFGLYESSGWNVGASGSYRARADWQVQGSYHLDLGFGAARSEANVRVQRDLGTGNHVAVSAIGFERQFEFRVSQGTVFGLGLDGGYRLSPRNRLGGSITAFRHRSPDATPTMDWSQVRGSFFLEWTVGPEPGMGARITGGGGDR